MPDTLPEKLGLRDVMHDPRITLIGHGCLVGMKSLAEAGLVLWNRFKMKKAK